MKAEHRKAVLDRWNNHKSWIYFYCPNNFLIHDSKCKPIKFPRTIKIQDYKTELFCPICGKNLIQGHDEYTR